ncbi:MAG: M23 family metallopeptidase [Nocardioidaceae bacterium]
MAFGAGAPGAAAQSGGAAAAGSSGYVIKPTITKLACVSRCASGGRAQAGATLRISGYGLAAVRTVVFTGSYGVQDDASVPVRSRSYRRIDVRVPANAVSGPVVAQVSSRLRSRPSKPLTVVASSAPEPNPTLTPLPGAPLIETGTSRTKAFVGARPAVTFSFRVGVPLNVQVQLVRGVDGAVVLSWPVVAAQPGVVQSLSWTGIVGSLPAQSGRYAFQLNAQGANGAPARSSSTQDFRRDAFDLYDHAFPVPAAHSFGSSGARFGAGRAGHSHQGQDVMASCGTPLLAARGGTVQYNGYHGAAGNYVVIDGDGTGTDYTYMHLRERSPFRKGDRVYTGQRIGTVGQTGNARGCHLHFEMWAPPGWYEGGKPFDPYPSLLAWDSWS